MFRTFNATVEEATSKICLHGQCSVGSVVYLRIVELPIIGLAHIYFLSGSCWSKLFLSMSLHLPSDTPHHDFPKAGRPLLRNAWSASTLLGGVTALDIQAVKRELSDDPAELRKYYEAAHVVRQKYLHLGPPCLKLIMTFCQIALKNNCLPIELQTVLLLL